MATNKNITMKQFNGTDYDTLYPKTKVEQVEGAYTQQQILSDSTKTLYGLDTTAVPDDALALLSRFHKGLGNEYVWEKTTEENNPAYTVNHTTNFGAAVMGATIYYADSFTIINNSFVLTNPQSFVWQSYTDVSVANVLRGKFATSGNSSTTMFANMFKPDSNATFSKGHDNILTVSATEYYNEPHIEKVITSYGYVNSPDPNAYPPAVSDGYTYTALGQLGNKVQMATGSYVGTGNAGIGSPNSLTFDFVPKLVIVGTSYGLFISSGYLKKSFVWFSGTETAYVDSTENVFNLTDNTLSWYNRSNNADKQCNGNGGTYYYVAIG